jgi:hypothetical protein
VGKYFPDDDGVFSAIAPGMALPPTSLWSNAGNDAYITTALIASFDINIENTLQSLCPGY